MTVHRKRQPTRRKRLPRGGKLKPSEILGGISAAAAGASALGISAPLTLPIAGLTGIAAGILKLFGRGGVTASQAQALRRAQAKGLVIGKVQTRKSRARKPGLRRIKK